MRIDRRGFLGRALGALTLLPNLPKSKSMSIRGASRPVPLELLSRVKLESHFPALGLPGPMAKKTIRFEDYEKQRDRYADESGFGVIYYVDPSGLFELRKTDSDA